MSRAEFLRYCQQDSVTDSDITPNYAEDLYAGFEVYLATKNGPTHPTTSTPNTEGSASVPQMTIEDLLLAPGRSTLTTLDPERKGKSTWFKYDKGEINAAILKMLRSDLPGAYPSYNHLPKDVQTRWFRAFAQQFNWEPSITETVRAAFEKKVRKSFSSNLCEWKERWKLKKDPPVSMSETKWKNYIKMWQDEKVEATAQKNSKNRKSERDGHGIAVHNTGSKTYERRKDELTAENGGEEPICCY